MAGRNKTIEGGSLNPGCTVTIPELEALALLPPRYQAWSEREVRVLQSYYGRVSVQQIAKYLGRTNISVSKKAQALGCSAADAVARSDVHKIPTANADTNNSQSRR